MPSMTQTILAVAVPLGLCLFFSTAILLGFIYRQRRQHRQHQRESERIHADLSELQKRLESFPRAWKKNDFVSGFRDVEIMDAFSDFSNAVSKYTARWIAYDTPSPNVNYPLSRIEAVLFPEPPKKHILNANKDIRIFPNPHNYTAAEINVYLEQNDTRLRIAEHLMLSIILPNVSSAGDPFKTLLPFLPSTVCGLDRLLNSIRHIELFDEVPRHISKFGFYFQNPELGRREREIYRQLFETLFEPYYKPESKNSNSQRRGDFEEVMDKAINFGMKVLGCSSPIEIRWGNRLDGVIMTFPGVYLLHFGGQELQQSVQLIGNSYQEETKPPFY